MNVGGVWPGTLSILSRPRVVVDFVSLTWISTSEEYISSRTTSRDGVRVCCGLKWGFPPSGVVGVTGGVVLGVVVFEVLCFSSV